MDEVEHGAKINADKGSEWKTFPFYTCAVFFIY